jgi:hypothetical protein
MILEICLQNTCSPVFVPAHCQCRCQDRLHKASLIVAQLQRPLGMLDRFVWSPVAEISVGRLVFVEEDLAQRKQRSSMFGVSIDGLCKGRLCLCPVAYLAPVNAKQVVNFRVIRRETLGCIEMTSRLSGLIGSQCLERLTEFFLRFGSTYESFSGIFTVDDSD